MFRYAAYEHTELVEQFTPGVLFLYTPSTFLNGYINLVQPWKVWLLERYTTQGPKYEAGVLQPFLAGAVHTSLKDLHDDVWVLAETKQWWWVLVFDCDVSDCAIGRVARAYEAAPPVSLIGPRVNIDGSELSERRQAQADVNRKALENVLQQERSAGYRGAHPYAQYTREQVVAWAQDYLDRLVCPTVKQERLDNLAAWDNADADWESVSSYRELPVGCLKGWVQW